MLRICAAALSLVLLSANRTPDDGDDQYQFLFGLQRKGMHELVVKEAKTFLRDYASHEKRDLARYRMAFSLFELDRFKLAEIQFAELVELDDFEFEKECWFRLGQCRLELDRFGAAADAFEQVAEWKEDYLALSAVFLLGEARFQAGEFEAAARAYDDVLKEGNQTEHARDAAYGRAWCAFRMEQHTLAAKHVRAFLSVWGEDELADELRHLLGESEMAAGRPEQALAAFNSVGPGEFHEAALHGAGFASAKLGNHVEAARSFATLIDGYPKSRFSAEAALHLGIHLVEAVEFESALAAFELPQASPDAELYYWKARAHSGLDQLEQALRSLNRARSAKPSGELEERINIARGDVLFQLNRTDEASRAYSESGSEYAIYAAAVARYRAGDAEEAARLASEQLERFPNGEYALLSQLTLGEALFELERYSEAQTAFQNYAARSRSVSKAERDPKLDQALVRLGWCAFLLEEWAMAAKTFEEVAGSPSGAELRAEALYMQGQAREKLGQNQQAKRALGSYVNEFPSGKFASSALMSMARLSPGAAGLGHLEKLVTKYSESDETPAALLELGERLLDAARFIESGQAYHRLRTEYPRHELVAAALYGEAWASYSRGEDAVTLELLRELGRLESPKTELGLAALELAIFAADRSENVQAAVGAWRRFADHCSDDARLLACARTVAGVLERAGELRGAREVMSQATARLQERASIVAARVEGVWLALSANDVSGASSELREALQLDAMEPAVCEAAFFLGEARYESGDNREAIELYRIASKASSPVADRALYMHGFASLRLKQNVLAAEAFQNLVDAHPRSELVGESLYLVGESHFRAGQFAKTVVAHRRLLTEFPKHAVVPKVLFRLGVAECQLEKWSAGQKTLADLARRFPDFEHGVEAELWRGRALAAGGSLRAARQALARVISRDEGVLAARARLELGRVALAEEDTETALSEFLKVALLFGYEEEVAEALLFSGQCLELQGKHDRAREQYLELLEKYPNSTSAGEARERLQS